ncbi:MAG: hypothetical protein NDI94_01125 [Candidatus Woesearchaeota archaeon]|nr:hypothetical protein [Candidatus Woesearchaeota archaeon]
MFLIVYDDRGYLTNLPMNGRLTVKTDLFSLEYKIYFPETVERVSPSWTRTSSGWINGEIHSDMPLRKLDNLIMHEYGIIKVEVIKGILHFQGRPISEYFYDPENCSSRLPPFDRLPDMNI